MKDEDIQQEKDTKLMSEFLKRLKLTKYITLQEAN